MDKSTPPVGDKWTDLTLEAEKQILGCCSELHSVLRNSAELTELCDDMQLNSQALQAQQAGQDEELKNARQRNAKASAAVDHLQERINTANAVSSTTCPKKFL